MRILLLKLTRLFFVSVFFFFVISFALQHNPSYQVPSKLLGTNYLFLGHSHMECSINDSVIENSLNLSSSGEAYLYTYQKLKIAFDHLPNLRFVFLEVTDNVFKESFNKTYFRDKYLLNRYHNFAYKFNFSDHLLIALKNPIGYLNANSIAIRNNVNVIMHSEIIDIQSLGGHLKLEKVINKDELDYILLESNENKQLYDGHSLSINYLNDIVKFCNLNNIQLCFVRSPQHPIYRSYFRHRNFHLILEKYFPTIPFLDFNDRIIDDHYFADLEHLNKEGAEQFSKIFKYEIIAQLRVN